ncbi:helix-turn-helix domain-containing protein [Virgibacillus kimchii]
MNKSILAKRLKKLRDERGYKQTFVADKIGVKSNTLSGYENGTRSPDPQMIVQLSELYNVSTDYLLGKTDIPNAENEDEEKRSYMVDKILKILEKYPEMDLAFDDLANMDAKKLERVYDFIKYQVFTEGD